MVTTACLHLQLFYVTFTALMANLNPIFRFIKTKQAKGCIGNAEI